MSEVTQLLLSAQSPDAAEREAAEQALIQARENDLPNFLMAMANELGTETVPSSARALAALQIKNRFSAHVDTKRAMLAQEWREAIPEEVKAAVRAASLSAVASAGADRVTRHAGATLVSCVAGIDLPAGQWDDVIGVLLGQVTTPEMAPVLKEAALRTLGFICEQIDADLLQEQANQILTAIVEGMRSENTDVRFAATNALANALVFVSSNMEHPKERDFIMRVVCEATTCEDVRVKKAALQCLVQIASLYYHVLESYMHALFQITMTAMRDEDEDVAVQAIEFWSTLAEDEAERILAAEEDGGAVEPDQECKHYVAGALATLGPVQLEMLTKQDEDDDEDDWTRSMAAATCLGLVSTCVGTDVLGLVMPFVQTHIQNPDWHFREAAVLAFGSVLDGPDETTLLPLATEAVPMLRRLMLDESVQVRDTTAWTLGRVCDFLPDAVLPYLEQLVPAFVESMRDEVRVANNVAWAIHNLAFGLADKTNALAPYFEVLAETLMNATQNDELSTSSMEALNMLIQHSSDDMAPYLHTMLEVFMQRLQASFTMDMSHDKRIMLQGLLCASLQVTIQRLDADAAQYARPLMELLIAVMNSSSATVHEEALMCVGTVANACSAAFAEFVPALMPFLMRGLENFEESAVCEVAVGVVGDLARALQEQVAHFAQPILSQLLKNLSNPLLSREVKPSILSCFGDLALAINGAFEPYMATVMSMLLEASKFTISPDADYDLLEHLQHLREGVLEAYTGIIQGMREGGKTAQLEPFAENILGFVAVIADDTERDEAVTRAAAGVVGDLVHSMGARAARHVMANGAVQGLLRECAQSEDDSSRQIGEWAVQILSHAT